MTNPIVVRTTKAVGSFPKDAELGYRSEADAKAILGDAFEIVRFQDGQPLPEKQPAAKPAAKKQD